MSIRYGVLLIPEPSFTARAYRARQLICGQYGSWAAEMHMLHLTVAGYFQCPDSAIDTLGEGLGEIAEDIRQRTPQFPLSHRGVAPLPDAAGNIVVDFSGSQSTGVLHNLHRDVIGLLGRTPGATLEMEHAGDDYWPHISLMQYATHVSEVFADAMEFARDVVADLQLPASTHAWRLLLVRFRSEAAGNDWTGGRWAADLSWETLSSYSL
ncbi:MAG: 2'-5' RNA ligase family protein [Chloroflexi bacterium]|nr:2'-5' RNA ligase family protein [Chloroflexota bacterium]